MDAANPLGAGPRPESLYFAVGKAIANFQVLTAALERLFNVASLKQHITGDIFNALGSFGTQVDVTEVVILVKPFNGDVFDEWFDLKARLATASAFRNTVAHAPVVVIQTDEHPDGICILFDGFERLSSAQRRIHLSRNRKQGVGPRDESDDKARRMLELFDRQVDAAKVLEEADGFLELAQRVNAYADRVSALLLMPR